MIQFNQLVTLSLAAALSFGALAERDIYTFLDGKNIYNKVKNDSVEDNLGVFKIYEKQTSKKIIAACIRSGVGYSVAAQWDLNIHSHAEAEAAMQALCERQGAFGGVLLGYKAKKEIRF